VRVLVLASYIPSYYKGAEIRLLHLLRNLSARHEITLWAINRRGVPVEEIAALLPDCRLLLQEFPPLGQNRLAAKIGYSRVYRWWLQRRPLLRPLPAAVDTIFRPALKERLEAFLASEQFDLIHVNQIMVWKYLPLPVETPVLLCKDNAWADLAEREWQAAAGWLPRRLKKVEADKMHRYEQQAVSAADHCVVVSERDKELIHQLSPDTPISVVPNGVDTDYFQPTSEPNDFPKLVFTGAMGWPPNVDAMLYFGRQILPLIRQEFPQVQMTIAGLHPPEELLALGQQANIRVTGFVPDVRPYIAEAAVYVVPLRLGSGTRLKILEALAMGKAVVSTSIGAEGLEVNHNEHLIIADEPEEFARSVSELLKEPSRRQALGRAGRTVVEACYDWKAVSADLEKIYRHVARS
jgi:sugar transferase (PEP-CTERM/EpsH1 system associated)